MGLGLRARSGPGQGREPTRDVRVVRELAERQERLLAYRQRRVGHAVEQHRLRLVEELERREARGEDTRGVGLRLVWRGRWLVAAKCLASWDGRVRLRLVPIAGQ